MQPCTVRTLRHRSCNQKVVVKGVHLGFSSNLHDAQCFKVYGESFNPKRQLSPRYTVVNYQFKKKLIPQAPTNEWDLWLFWEKVEQYAAPLDHPLSHGKARWKIIILFGFFHDFNFKSTCLVKKLLLIWKIDIFLQ